MKLVFILHGLLLFTFPGKNRIWTYVVYSTYKIEFILKDRLYTTLNILKGYVNSDGFILQRPCSMHGYNRKS